MPLKAIWLQVTTYQDHPMNTALDPWNDASLLADRLSQKDAALFVIVGAEQWCEKCRDLRPHFDAYMAQADSQDIWLWLDLEDHTDFMGDYMPDSLPMLIAYKGSKLVASQVLEVTPNVLSEAVSQINSASLIAQVALPEPGIRSRLLQQDWAS
jgi:thioredoxin-like negative regulator of GroEL